MQAHLEAGVPELDQKALAQFCQDVASLGLKICITEMDVRDNREPADIATRDAGVAAQGKAFLDAVLANPAVIGVVTWGLSDRRSWLNKQWPRTDGLPQRPLPLDTDMIRKPLWTAIGQSLAASGRGEGKEGQGLCPWTPLRAEPSEPHSRLLRRGGADGGLNQHLSRPSSTNRSGSKGRALGGVQGQRPWPSSPSRRRTRAGMGGGGYGGDDPG